MTNIQEEWEEVLARLGFRFIIGLRTNKKLTLALTLEQILCYRLRHAAPS